MPVGREQSRKLANEEIERASFLKAVSLGALSLAGLPAALTSIESALAAGGDRSTTSPGRWRPHQVLNFFSGFNHTTKRRSPCAWKGWPSTRPI